MVRGIWAKFGWLSGIATRVSEAVGNAVAILGALGFGSVAAYLAWLDKLPLVAVFLYASGGILMGLAVGAFVVVLRDHWRALDKAEELSASTLTALDPIRRDIGGLKEGLLSYGRFEDQRAQLAERYQRLRSSDHIVWLDDNIRQLRGDFLNRCGIAIDQSNRYATLDERNNIRAEIESFAKALDQAIVDWVKAARVP